MQDEIAAVGGGGAGSGSNSGSGEATERGDDNVSAPETSCVGGEGEGEGDAAAVAIAATVLVAIAATVLVVSATVLVASATVRVVSVMTAVAGPAPVAEEEDGGKTRASSCGGDNRACAIGTLETTEPTGCGEGEGEECPSDWRTTFAGAGGGADDASGL